MDEEEKKRENFKGKNEEACQDTSTAKRTQEKKKGGKEKIIKRKPCVCLTLKNY